MRGPRRTRASVGSPEATARTRPCSPTRRSTPSTSRCPTGSTTSGRLLRWTRESTSSARSRTRVGPTRSSEAFARAESTELVLMEAFMFRHHPQTEKVKALVDDGAVGRVRLVKAGFRFVLPGLDDIRASTELDGGALMDVGCYCVSGVTPARGRARARERRSRSSGRRASTCRSTGPCVSPTTSSRSSTARSRCRGTRGSRSTETRAASSSSHRGVPIGRATLLLHRDGGVERIEVPTGDAYRLELENFAGAAAGTASPLASAGPTRSDRRGRSTRSTASAAEGRAVDALRRPRRAAAARSPRPRSARPRARPCARCR